MTDEELVGAGLIVFVVGGAIAMVAFRGWMGQQGEIADAQIEAGDNVGCLLTSASVFGVCMAIVVGALVVLAISQGGF